MNEEMITIAGASAIIGERVVDLAVKPLINKSGFNLTAKQLALIAMAITAVINVSLTYLITGEVNSLAYALGLTSGGLANGWHQLVTDKNKVNNDSQ